MAQAGSNFPAVGFEGLQGWRRHSYCGQPVLVLQHSNSDFFSCDLMEFSIFQFVSPVLSLGITEGSLVPSYLNPPEFTDFACIP